MKKKSKQKNKITYFNELKDENGFIYSIDNLRIEFTLDKKYEASLSNLFSKITRTDISHYENFKFHNYRHLWTISYDANSSMTVGYSLNGTDYHSDLTKGFIDVNPNKVGSYEQFWKDYYQIKSMCKYFNVKRCDIALDIPIKREYLTILKTNKKYEQVSKSQSNKTEYLGMRSKLGFIKLYNKTMQSNLDYDLSRIEITCLLSAKSYKQYFPTVYDISRNGKLSDELNQLNDTERAIVKMESLLMQMGGDDAYIIFNSMGRGMKKKLREFIMEENHKITYSEDVIEELIQNAQKMYLDK